MLGNIWRCVSARNSAALSLHHHHHQQQLQQQQQRSSSRSSLSFCGRNSGWARFRKAWDSPFATTTLRSGGAGSVRSSMGGVEGSFSGGGGGGGGGDAAAASSHKHTNRLKDEESPYLLQHAHNPVNWYPWGNEAFAKARAEDKPIFLSVGYSTCHWCHVMEVESFESEKVAKLMNDWFVSIKVDREERPDVDKVYMTYVQATQGGGGWPMSVFLTPELKPIVGGTYFPPDDKYGRPGFKTVLRRVHEVWKEKKDVLRETGDQIVQQLSDASTANSTSMLLPKGFAQQAIQLCVSQLAKGFDPKLGGFGGPPKFPRPVEIMAVLQGYKRLEQSGQETASSKLLEMALFSLRCMAQGGMHDHIGGGFHRYSVDEYWHVPHFEKMLYDQGQLANVYLDAFAITKSPEYSSVARDVLDYLRRGMTHPGGGIFSAEDADSAESESSTKKKEGSFYVWTSEEIETYLGKERAAVFATHYYVKPGGNCDLSRGSDPHNEFTGKNVLIDRQGLAETAAKVKMSVEELDRELGKSREELYGHRQKRPSPHIDDKVIVAWNGLAISAFARASRILKIPQSLNYNFPVTGCDCREYLAAAEGAARFIRTKLYNERRKRLSRSYRKGPSKAPGFLDDYAFLIAGLLDLYEAGGDTQWLSWALDLHKAQDDQFLDIVCGGYYSTSVLDSSILFRVKDDYDGAEPSGNSVAAINFLRLGSIITGAQSESFLRRVEHLLSVFVPRVREVAMAVPLMCCAFDLFAAPSKRQIVIAGVKQAPDTEALVDAAFSIYDPDKIILQIDETNAQDRQFWEKHNPNALAMARKNREGKAVAYVCQNFACLAPVETPEGLKQTLRQAPPAPKLTTFKLGATPK